VAEKTALLTWSIGQVQRAATQDPGACRALVELTNMLAPPRALVAPRVVWQVARTRLRQHAVPAGLTPVTAEGR